MSKLKEQIDFLVPSLIGILDQEKDSLLIGLLQEKISSVHSNPLDLPDDELRLTKSQCKSHIKSIIPITDKVERLDRIIKEQRNCEVCPLSVRTKVNYLKNTFTGLSRNKESKVCDSCMDRVYDLDETRDNLITEYENRINSIMESETVQDIIQMKTIIKIANQKLKDL